MIFIGGLHELEEICALRDLNVIGAIDHVQSPRSRAKYLGNDTQADAVLTAYPDALLHITPDKPQLRQKLWADYIDGRKRKPVSLIHPSVIISDSSVIGEGCAFHMGVLISSANKIGKGVKINTGGIVTHDIVIEDFVSIAPAAVICSACFIGTGAYIGANATILPGVKIGANAFIGAGATVTRDVAVGETVYGNPAEIAKGKAA